MKPFSAKAFKIPALKGISAKTIEEHLKLYEGYVKHLNLIHEIVENQSNPEYARREAYRRQGFEFGGMRNHEIYFSCFEGGARVPDPRSALGQKMVAEGSTVEGRIEIFKNLATTRGVGWAMLGYDKKTDRLIQYWVDEQHLGQLPEVSIILALDLWEHSYVADYQPSGKKQYVEDFFINLNWKVIEEYFAHASR